MLTESNYPLRIKDTPTLLSQSQVAQMLGICPSRVSQIELRALEKIRLAVLRDRVLCQLAAEAGCQMPHVQEVAA